MNRIHRSPPRSRPLNDRYFDPRDRLNNSNFRDYDNFEDNYARDNYYDNRGRGGMMNNQRGFNEPRGPYDDRGFHDNYYDNNREPDVIRGRGRGMNNNFDNNNNNNNNNNRPRTSSFPIKNNNNNNMNNFDNNRPRTSSFPIKNNNINNKLNNNSFNNNNDNRKQQQIRQLEGAIDTFVDRNLPYRISQSTSSDEDDYVYVKYVDILFVFLETLISIVLVL
jgi:hypothetical protein